MKKKLLLVFLAFMLVFTLVGCSGEETTTAAASQEAETPITEASVNDEAKEAFKEYINAQVAANFGPKNDEIVMQYLEAVALADGDVLATTLTEIIVLNAHLYEEMDAYEPTTAEVAEIHSLFFAAVAARELAYTDILMALTDMEATEDQVNAAFDSLDEANNFFVQFMARVNELKAQYGF